MQVRKNEEAQEKRLCDHIYKEFAHMSLIDHPLIQPSLDISPIWTPVFPAELKNYNSVQCRLSGKISDSCVGIIRRIHLSSDDLFSVSFLVQGLICVEFLIF
jgi:hypothetical protein